MGHQPGETPGNIYSDYDWIKQHEEALLEKYGEQYIVVFECQIVGVGSTRQQALENAEQLLAPDVTEITPIVYKLYHYQPFFRVRPSHLMAAK